MMSQREAALKWSLGRATIQRAIKDGKLSLTPNKRLDPAEMLRVFGEPRPVSDANPAPPKATPETTHFEAKIAALEATVAAQAKHIESMDRAMLMLDHDRPRRRWWQRK